MFFSSQAFGDDIPDSFRTLRDVTYFFPIVKPFVTSRAAAETPPNSPLENSEQRASNDTEEIALLLSHAVVDCLLTEKRESTLTWPVWALRAF